MTTSNDLTRVKVSRPTVYLILSGRTKRFLSVTLTKNMYFCFYFQGTSIVKAIVYGNTAKYFGQKRSEDGHTHKWSVFVKPYLDEDMGTWVKKVHFKLHDSYESPTRVIQKPPFEINETGWGEFELVIKIFFQDTSERPVIDIRYTYLYLFRLLIKLYFYV